MGNTINRIAINLSNNFARFFIRNYLISFPKSGRTWVRMILCKYYSNYFQLPMGINLVDFNLFNCLIKKIPAIQFTHFGSHAADMDGGFSDVSKLKNKKVVFLVRDPRDIAVSYYFQRNRRDLNYQGSIASFIKDRNFGIEHIVNFMNYILLNKNIFGDFLLVRYEDLMEDAHSEMLKILHFFDANPNINANDVKDAVHYAEFENMKRMERGDAFTSNRLRPGNKNDPDSYKVRRGKIGGYRDYLSPDEINYMNEQMKRLDDVLNYKI